MKRSLPWLLWGVNFGKYLFGDTLLLPDGYRKQKSSIPLFEWLNRYRNIYAYIYIKRIRRMEMKCSRMPKFDGHNKDNTHMHTYVIR